jgi:ParB family chromosome partitioning protein
MAERRLGRGLDFLISRTAPAPGGGAAPAAASPAEGEATVLAPSGDGTIELPIDGIKANPFQPRTEFEPGALRELEESIRLHGVLQPVVVRRQGAGYQLVAGERRLRASKAVGKVGIPAVIRDVTDAEMLTLALVENLQRSDLNAIETGLAYQQMMTQASLTQEAVAELVGKSRAAVANTLRLLDLPEDLRELVSRGTLSAGHGRALLSLPDEGAMRLLAERILEEGLSVREAERATQAEGEAEVKAAPPPPRLRPVRSAHIEELEARLRGSLGTRVAVRPGRGKRGKIVLYYASLEDFDRLFEILVSEEGTPNPTEAREGPFQV